MQFSPLFSRIYENVRQLGNDLEMESDRSSMISPQPSELANSEVCVGFERSNYDRDHKSAFDDQSITNRPTVSNFRTDKSPPDNHQDDKTDVTKDTLINVKSDG